MAYVDKLGKYKNGVNYLLLRQDVFDRTVDAKRRKRKAFKKAVGAFSTMVTKKESIHKNWVHEGTELPGEFNKLYGAEGVQFYSTMSETKAPFTERTSQSLKNKLYCYMEDSGFKYIHKMSQFVTALISRKNVR